jgi:hypothetical protein
MQLARLVVKPGGDIHSFRAMRYPLRLDGHLQHTVALIGE